MTHPMDEHRDVYISQSLLKMHVGYVCVPTFKVGGGGGWGGWGGGAAGTGRAGGQPGSVLGGGGGAPGPQHIWLKMTASSRRSL